MTETSVFTILEENSTPFDPLYQFIIMAEKDYELEADCLDDLFAVFNARQHPIIAVEECAMQWMGLRVRPENV